MGYNAENKYSYDKITNLLSYAVALNPDGAFPLDARVYFGALGDAVNPAEGTARYAAKHAKPAGSSESAYFYGQQLYVVENDKVTTYLIQTDGTLKEVGVTTKGDGKSIVTKQVNGETVLSIAGLDDEQVTAGKILIADGDGGISWSSTSQEDLNADLDEITSRLDDLELTVDGGEVAGPDNTTTKVPGLVEKVEALETKLANTGSIFNFAGSLTQEEFGKIELNGQDKDNYQVGDVVIVDGSKEYVCYTDYVITVDTAIDNNKIYYIKNEDGTFTTAEIEEGANPKENKWYVFSKMWEAFGDPSGVTTLEQTVGKLQETVDKNVVAIDTNTKAISGINEEIGVVGTKDTQTLQYSGHSGLYEHVHNYVVEYADAAEDAAKSYTDDLITGDNGINDQIDELDGRLDDAEGAIEVLQGKDTDNKDAASIVGVKKYAESVGAGIVGTASDGKDALTLYGIKAYADDKVANAIDSLDGLIDDNASAIDAIEAKLEKVTNVMDFCGIVEELPAASDSQKGDVVILKIKDETDTTKVLDYAEYVFDGTAWQAIGTVDINNQRLNALDQAIAGLQDIDKTLQDTIDEHDGEIDGLDSRMDSAEETLGDIIDTVGYTLDSSATGDDADKAKTVYALLQERKSATATVANDLTIAIQDYTDKIDALDGELDEKLSWGTF